MEFGMLFRLVNLMDLMLILSHSMPTQGRKIPFGDNSSISGLLLHIYRPISFKHRMMIDTTDLYGFVPV